MFVKRRDAPPGANIQEGGRSVDDILNLIANVGFPIAVAVFLLVRIENKITGLTTAIGELREAILTMPREQPGSVYTAGRSTVREGL
jgi:hypothetical protein